MRAIPLWIFMASIGCTNPPSPVTRPQPVVERPVATALPAPDVSDVPARADAAFAESETNRDPFRRHAIPEAPAPDLAVRLADAHVDELRVVGIVSGITSPRALVVGRDGEGHILRRGEYVGRSHVTRGGGSDSLAIALHWRVSRIRRGDVVLERRDPRAPTRAPLRRVLALDAEG